MRNECNNYKCYRKNNYRRLELYLKKKQNLNDYKRYAWWFRTGKG